MDTAPAMIFQQMCIRDRSLQGEDGAGNLGKAHLGDVAGGHAQGVEGFRRVKIQHIPEIPREQRHDFHITDDALGHGTPSEKYAANAAAILSLIHI